MGAGNLMAVNKLFIYVYNFKRSCVLSYLDTCTCKGKIDGISHVTLTSFSTVSLVSLADNYSV